MMLHLDLHDPRPMYEQVIDQIETLVARGVLPADSKLPSVRQMAIELSLNPNTVQKAYSELLSRGVIYSVRGKGNYISGDRIKIQEKRLHSIRRMILELIRQAKEMGATTEQCNELLRSCMEVKQR